MFDFATVLKMLPAIGPVAASVPEFREVFSQIVATFSADKQTELKEALADVVAQNDAGHRRIQDKLARAAQQP